MRKLDRVVLQSNYNFAVTFAVATVARNESIAL